MIPPRPRWLLALLVFSLALVAAIPVADAKGRGKRGSKAHELVFEDINPRSETHGELLSLSDLYAEEGIVLQFTASWCKFCREEMPNLQAYYSQGDTPMVFVAADEGPMDVNILTIAERAELTAPLLFVPDGEAEKVNRHYPYEVLPATYFIDAKGRIRGTHQGEISVDRLSHEVDSLLRIKGASPLTTDSHGD